MEQIVIDVIKRLEQEKADLSTAALSSVKFETEYARLVGMYQHADKMIELLRQEHARWVEAIQR